jgi:hypothetical protein
MSNNPNSFDEEIKDAQGANPETPSTEGTEQKETDKTGQETVDYRKKFIESSKGAQQLLAEKKALEEENARLKAGNLSRPDATDDLIPGFDTLDPEAQNNLLAYTNAVVKKTREEIYKDPAIAFAHSNYNETKFNNALDVVIAQFPALAPHKEEFRGQYFNPNNVPDNIQEILESMAKVYLFDKAKDIGAEEAKAAADRVDLEDTTGGDRTPTARRTLSDWQLMARTNPAKFASLKKEYEADLESGQLKE